MEHYDDLENSTGTSSAAVRGKHLTALNTPEAHKQKKYGSRRGSVALPPVECTGPSTPASAHSSPKSLNSFKRGLPVPMSGESLDQSPPALRNELTAEFADTNPSSTLVSVNTGVIVPEEPHSPSRETNDQRDLAQDAAKSADESSTTA